MRYALCLLAAVMLLALLPSCHRQGDARVDALNERAYSFHYRSLDSTMAYARRAYAASQHYSAGRAEAMNHMAFASIARMRYREAEATLHRIEDATGNQVELLVADVQMMRLCQRQSRNRDFYVYRSRAERRLARIREESQRLDAHQMRRMVYANTEYDIVCSTYYYYVGLRRQSVDALADIDPNGPIMQDTTQLLGYLYNVGSGGIISRTDPAEAAQEEMDHLIRCYFIAMRGGYDYWQAQAMQGMSEHLMSQPLRRKLLERYSFVMRMVNVDQMPDSLLAGNLAQRALAIFRRYGDVYQEAGACRTLAECYWAIGDYRSALACLNEALGRNRAINQAPDLVASIREQLCLVYSAVDDKPRSDRNRNIYLDLQEQTRQDRMLEARAAQLDDQSTQLNAMLAAVVVMIVVVVLLLLTFSRLRRRSDARFSIDRLLEPLRQWQERADQSARQGDEAVEEIAERQQVEQLHLEQNERRHMEQRAKVSLVASVLPLIDRIVCELRLLRERRGPAERRGQRYEYIAELADTITATNAQLTRWIQMRQGEVRLRIETFPLDDVLSMVRRSSMGFRLRGIELVVDHTDQMVKADRAMTLFMVNTISDNARKFTPVGGRVHVYAKQQGDAVEVSIADTGCGMTEEQAANVFCRTYTGGHGFGLKNCNGIIEKYKKLSRIFSVCAIGADSTPGQGTRVYFRLPRGVARAIAAFAMSIASGCCLWGGGALAAENATPTTNNATAAHGEESIDGIAASQSPASRFADSAYYSNIAGRYSRTLQFADSCRRYLSPRDTATLLDISNETAVAALALHRWELYRQSNQLYTSLFRQASADSSLPDYVMRMQRSQTNKTVAIILLVLLLVSIPPAYYLLYYRHVLSYRYCIGRIDEINRILASDLPDGDKLNGIRRLGRFGAYRLTVAQRTSLGEVVGRIERALQSAIDRAATQQVSQEMAEDELRRIHMEQTRLYVANNVLDNSLSTLKHETMYYPSKIRQLIRGDETDVDALAELAGYYQELYSVLTLQATGQLVALRPHGLAPMLEALLTAINDGHRPSFTIVDRRGGCVVVHARMNSVNLSAQEADALFTHATADLRFLVCRQMVRDMGEATHLRQCGIGVRHETDVNSEGLVVVITMPERLYKDNKTTKA